ncbi:MAG: hypothetical protein ACX93U_24240 [Salipiger thiooxidans]|uniref:hypothetical protein n=1 Tax=Salipiger thiooxidans TaxID=282683 RepID=UPI001CF99E46|nr:hypothetical protein [Salipiger thiooxidans]
MRDTTQKMTVTLSINARPWWKRLGLAGTLIAYVALGAGVPLKAFFEVQAT